MTSECAAVHSANRMFQGYSQPMVPILYMSSWVLVSRRNAKRYEKKDQKPEKEEKPKRRTPETSGGEPAAKQPKRRPKK